MSDNRRRDDWLDEATAERLLRGGSVNAPDGRAAALAGLLAAAAASSKTAVDPQREEAAVAAFRAARAAGPQTRGRGTAARSAKAVKASIAAVAAAVTLGGVAVAAGTGVIPTPFAGGSVVSEPVSGSPDGRTPGSSGSARPGITNGTPSGSGAPSTSARPGIPVSPDKGDGSTSPSDHRTSPSGNDGDFHALCRAYLDAADKHSGTDSPDFDRLVKAAGGKHKVAHYCEELLATGHDGGGKGSGSGSGGDSGGKDLAQSGMTATPQPAPTTLRPIR